MASTFNATDSISKTIYPTINNQHYANKFHIKEGLTVQKASITLLPDDNLAIGLVVFDENMNYKEIGFKISAKAAKRLYNHLMQPSIRKVLINVEP